MNLWQIGDLKVGTAMVTGKGGGNRDGERKCRDEEGMWSHGNAPYNKK